MNENSIGTFQEAIATRKRSLSELQVSLSKSKIERVCNSSVCDVDEVISQCDHALERIETDQFEICTECNDKIEPERLELDFTTCVCLDHYSEPQKRILERDLELAAKMQRQLLPRTLPVMNKFQVVAFTEPAQIVGGDYFDFFTAHDQTQGVAIADVMGKGVAASMLVASLQTSLRILGPEHSQLHSLANRLNDLFIYNTKMISFITLFQLRIDEETGKLIYCNAGHNPAIWWKKESSQIQWLKPTGPAIGLNKKAVFTSEELSFSSGDLLLLYTDGCIEAQNAKGNEFGKDRLVNFVQANAHLPVKEFLNDLYQELKKFSGKFTDDMTLIVLKAD